MLTLEEFIDLSDEVWTELKLYETELSENDVRDILFFALERTSILHPEVNKLSYRG